MNSGRRVYATTTTAAAFFLCCVCVLAARAWAGDDDDARIMLFSGRDLGRNGAFGYGGLVLAPGGFQQDGLLLKALLSDGPYRFSGGNVRKERTDSLAQVLPGWRIKRGDTELKFFF